MFPIINDRVLLASFYRNYRQRKNNREVETHGLPHPVTNRIISYANRNCRRGGFDIFQDIPEIKREKLATEEFVKICLGDEGSAKGGKLGWHCVNTLHYRLTLKYKLEYSPEGK